MEILVALRNRSAPREPTSPEAFRAMTLEGQILRTIEVEGRAVGFGMLRPWPWGGGPGVLAISVFVDEALRRKGLGRRLYEDLLEDAGRRNWTSLRGGYYESSPGADDFSRALGFEVWLREDAFSLNLDGDYDSEFRAAKAKLDLADLEFTTLDKLDDPEKHQRFHEFCLPVFRQVPEFQDSGDLDFDEFFKGNLKHPPFQENCIFLVLQKGRILAYTQHRMPPGGQPFIHMTGTHPDFQRRGLARAVKLYSQREQMRRGFTEINTGSAEGNEGMQALNRNLGFRVSDGYLFIKRDHDSGPGRQE